MNNVKLLNIKCVFFQFFNSQVALKNIKKFAPPRKSWNDAPVITVYSFKSSALSSQITSTTSFT